jgi:hypothetical protein
MTPMVELAEIVEPAEGTPASSAAAPSPAPSWEAECNCPEACNRDHEQD